MWGKTQVLPFSRPMLPPSGPNSWRLALPNLLAWDPITSRVRNTLLFAAQQSTAMRRATEWVHNGSAVGRPLWRDSVIAEDLSGRMRRRL